MGIFKNLFKTVMDNKTEKEQEKFENLSEEKKEEVLNKVLKQKDDLKAMTKTIENKPYILPHIIAKLDVQPDKVLHYVNAALGKGVSIYDLLDKSAVVSNDQMVNDAVSNYPEVLFELEDNKRYADLITAETVIEAFKKNPLVMTSKLSVLDRKMTLALEYDNGEVRSRRTTLRTQLKRALNLYFRPEAYSERNLDYYADEIASDIKSENFVEKVQDNKLTTRITTAANETLKRNPEKGRVMPASALHMNKNKVMYVIPNQAKKKIKNSEKNYEIYYNYLMGYLKNPAHNSSSNIEKVRLVKRYVSIIPEIYFGLMSCEGYDDVLNKLTVQLTTYETFKQQKKFMHVDTLLEYIGKENEKKVLARAKSNKTRKANKEKKTQAQKEEGKQLEVK